MKRTKNSKQEQKTASWKGLTGKGEFAKLSLEDFKRAGREAGEALKRI